MTHDGGATFAVVAEYAVAARWLGDMIVFVEDFLKEADWGKESHPRSVLFQ